MPFPNSIPGILIANSLRVNTNNVAFGCVIGLLFPAVAYLLTSSSANTLISGKPLGFYAVAALINLLLVRHFFRKDREQTARGIILATFVAVLALLIAQRELISM